ncbi:MAG TPA: phosphohistidine phosphatase SixA [Bacteroidetes bacterium]|nr:phosphohistidine phosphatase SixA [Bacteroidota bacterium]
MKKNIFIIRHTDAINFSTGTVTTDDKRYITEAGRKLSHEIFSKLKDKLTSTELILSSPLIRAVQTAEIFSSEINNEIGIEMRNELKHSSTSELVINMLEEYPEYKTITLVSHEPLVSYLVYDYTGRNFSSGFSKSGIASLTFSGNSKNAELNWYFNADTLKFS